MMRKPIKMLGQGAKAIRNSMAVRFPAALIRKTFTNDNITDALPSMKKRRK